MIKIIKDPPKEYVESCSKCGCVFSYELSDTVPSVLGYSSSVKCPSCGNCVEHKSQKKSEATINPTPLYSPGPQTNNSTECEHVWIGYSSQDMITNAITYHRRCQKCGKVETYEDSIDRRYLTNIHQLEPHFGG